MNGVAMDYTIRPVTLQDAENSLKSMLDDPNILFKVAESDGDLVGLVVSRRESLSRKRHVCSCGIGVVERC